nr:MAG TPA: hypothetical protein [Caudoviricetes sp.]
MFISPQRLRESTWLSSFFFFETQNFPSGIFLKNKMEGAYELWR